MRKRNGNALVGRTGGEPRTRRNVDRRGALGRRSTFSAVAALVTALGILLVISPASAGAASLTDQGVTSKTISVGVPYVNFVALRALGVTINEGSFPDAYTAIADYINMHGGVDGRKLMVNYAEMNPSITADQT